ncbi:MAG TPA: SDR family oxidoreductase [Burkholderiaceae bacterium]
MSKRLKDKVALVTGCGSSGPGWGNGKTMAVLFAREGARVFGCDIHLAAAQETRLAAASEGAEMEVAACDVADDAQVAAMVAQCVARHGRIDVLVNNVGIVNLGGVVECTLDAWQKAWAVNVTSMFLTCKHVVPHMQRQGGGSIVNIGSVAGIRDSGVAYVAYSTTKAATLGLSRSVALQYSAQNIRSNVILPGLMHTPMVAEPLKAGYGTATLDAMLDKRRQQCPMGRMGDAWDVAHAALWLASDESQYVSAAEIVVDGGLTAKFA